MAKQEDFLNRALAKLLTGLSIPTDYEQKVGLRRLDMVADVDGLRVVLEAEKGFHRKAQAIKDADARLKQRLATAVFAVCYPDGATEQNLADATLTWTLRLKPDEPSGDWSTGGVPQLAQAVWQAPGSRRGRRRSDAQRGARRRSAKDEFPGAPSPGTGARPSSH